MESSTTTPSPSTTKHFTEEAFSGNISDEALDRPFKLTHWLRLHGVDLLTMAAVAALCLGVHLAPPAPTQLFPIFNLDGSLVYPHLAYPRRRQIIPIWASALIAILVPFFFISLFQWRRRSLDDCLTSFMGVFKSVLTASLFQVIVKTLIGGLRPHFYSACQPNLAIATQALAQSSSSNIIPMFDKSICTGDKRKINDALQTMPSGHSTAAWAGLFFLSLYLNAQLKVMAAHNPAYWKTLVLFAPLLGATLLSGYLVTDGHHHSTDVIAGAFIGVCSAIIAFRQTFASVTDFRFNHILLPRSTSLLHSPRGSREPGQSFTYRSSKGPLLRDYPVCGEGGWGRMDAYSRGVCIPGAPGDATALVSGLKNGVQGASGSGPGNNAGWISGVPHGSKGGDILRSQERMYGHV